MQDKTLEMTLLFDFYGELLTDRQKSCFVQYYDEDLSLGEIAELMEISRQGVRDLIVRAEATLTEAEEKIGFVQRHTQQRETLDEMETQLNELIGLTEGKARALAEALQSALGRLRD